MRKLSGPAPNSGSDCVQTKKAARGETHVMVHGRSNDGMDVGAPRGMGESNASREPGYSMKKSMPGTSKSALKKGY